MEILQNISPEKARKGITEPIEEIRRIAKNNPLIIILDEYDKLLLETKDDDVLYQLHETDNTTTFIISNNIRWREHLGGDTMSRLKGSSKTVWFPNYTKEEMYNILADRAREALKPNTYTLSILMDIVEFVQQEGDARNILQLLNLSAELAEKEEANPLNENTSYKQKRACTKTPPRRSSKH